MVFLWWCGGVFVVVWWCFCGGVCVVVFLWRCRGGVFVVAFLWWRFCGGVLVVVFLWWCSCGGVFAEVFLWWCSCGGVGVVRFLRWFVGVLSLFAFARRWLVVVAVRARQVANGTRGEQLSFVHKLCLAGRLIPLLATCRKKRRKSTGKRVSNLHNLESLRLMHGSRNFTEIVEKATSHCSP